MPLKQVFTSAPAVYRVDETPGSFDYWAGEPENFNRVYDEYLWWAAGVAVLDNPASPTHYEVLVLGMSSTRYWPSWGFGAMRFDGLTGEFLGWDTRFKQYAVTDVSTGPDGNVWAVRQNHWIGKLDRTTGLFSTEIDLLDHYGTNVSSFWASSAPICVDLANDRAITRLARDGQNQLSICAHASGDALHQITVCGEAEQVFMADDRRAYCVSTRGVVTVFDYMTGQVLGVLDVGKSADPRRWAWDKTLKRILCFTHTPDDMPEGHCTAKLTGFYPTPVAAGMTPPIPLQIPRIDRQVPVHVRVYGAAGEGIAGAAVTFSLTDPAGGTLGPARVASDRNGTLRTYLTGVLAGDNTINASTEV